MANNSTTSNNDFLNTERGKTKSMTIEVPSISLPKGGGAIKGIDEKFSVNAVNGTAAFSIPLPFSPARGLSPALNISYNSGGGNGIFGLGWSLSLGSIKRKTDQELPQYIDTIDSDTFLLSEAEDLVSEFKRDSTGNFELDTAGNYIINERDSEDGLFLIRYYKPRTEGLFARIERWTKKDHREMKWRVITKDNTTTLYGWTPQSRITHPEDPGKIYEWLPEFIFDDKGNCTQHLYKKEDDKGFDTSQLHNRNRLSNGTISYTNTYLEKLLYGNKTPYEAFGAAFPPEADYMFQTEFDYGSLADEDPIETINEWDFRSDAFSNYKAGFEIRTTRLCKRVLLFHVFDELAQKPDLSDTKTLVRSLNFEYDTATETDFTFLKTITDYGYIKKVDGTYSHKKLPPMEFGYKKHQWSDKVHSITPENLLDAPGGLSGVQFIDLYNEGLSGMLTEQANGWYYKRNLGNGTFEAARLVTPKPSFTGLGAQLQLADLDADGGKQLVSYDTNGFFELDEDEQWQPMRYFKNLPNVDFGDANTRMIDLDGDGKPELLISEDQVFTWYASKGREGFAAARQNAKPLHEEEGPRIVFADTQQTIFLADMSGDGLTDIVRIRNGALCYWPNLGYGKFGAKVAVDHSPVFDHPEAFNPAYIKLADIDGSGTTDIIYLGKNKFRCWKNLSGNSFSTIPFEIESFPDIHNQAQLTVTDLLGNGVACIVWSSPLSKDVNAPLKYIDLMNSEKPHLMVTYKNNMGKEASLEYTPSTHFYIEDKLAGKPWATKLHFPVHCISKTTVEDKITGHKFTSTYKYHFGYYDHAEREFRGFGMVEQTDAESFEHWVKKSATNITEESLHQEPVVSKNWYHTGAFLRQEQILLKLEQDYWYHEYERLFEELPDHPERPLPDIQLFVPTGWPASLITELTGIEWQQGLRACKGMALRSEVFAYDGVKFGNTIDARKKAATPFSVATHNCIIELLQPKGQNKYAVFIVKESEAISYHYEREFTDPRIAHNLNIQLDEYGNVLESAAVVYPRKKRDLSLPVPAQEAQDEMYISYTKNQFTNDVIAQDHYRLRLPSETQTYQLKNVLKTGMYYTPDNFTGILLDTKSDTAAYHESDKAPVTGKAQKRLIEHTRSTYYKNSLDTALPLHQLEYLALPFESYQLAYTPELVHAVFGTKVNATLLSEGKFIHSESDSNWWIRSGTIQFIHAAGTVADAISRFYSPLAYTDPYGAITKVRYYGNYFLFIEETEDVWGNKAGVDQFNFRTLSPQSMKDINGNVSETISDELGIIKAVAIKGKGNEADELTGITEITDTAELTLIQDFIQAADSDQLTNTGKQLLQRASARFICDLEAYSRSGKPLVVAAITREQHFRQLANSPVQIAFEYSSGMGEVIMKKVQAEPGIAKQTTVNADDTISVNEVDTGTQLRWIGNGKTIKNNKGNAVKQYEPYFSVSWHYENYKELVETGVSPLMYYDAPGRLIKTLMPDGSCSKVAFDSWMQRVYDANDTVLESDWYKRRTDPTHPGFISDIKEQQAAGKAAQHADTPYQLHFDTLGRPIGSIEHNKNTTTLTDEWYNTIVSLDIESNLQSVTDERGNRVMHYQYDMLGNKIYQDSMDAGQRWLLLNILGKPLRTWDERDHEFQYFYDLSQRPTHSKVIGGDSGTILDHIFDRAIYGESLLATDRSNEAVLQARNILGQVIRHYDTGGLIDTPAYDFKGKALSTSRQLFNKYKETANWTDANLVSDLETEAFIFQTSTDALGRITRQIAPDGTIISPVYNEAGLLNEEWVQHPGTTGSVAYIKDIDYNEKGQREKIVYGNNVFTKFHYDIETFRLKQIETKRQNGSLLQDWHYTYDAVGNITHIEDKAAPVEFFRNNAIAALATYTYDALYRLIEANGRENNAGMNVDSSDKWNDQDFMQALNPGDPIAVRQYTQQYQYDAVGNIIQMQHQAWNNNWTRHYNYSANNNRLLSTKMGSQPDYLYTYHAQHGFMTTLPHLDHTAWNFKEELVKTIRQRRTDGGTAETTWYQYDGSGQRIRKITENQAAAGASITRKEERIYIAGYELYKRHSGAHTGLERISLSLMDEGHRFVMIETRNDIDDGTEKQLSRYQLHDHVGSAALELDETAEVISYEEYHPFGTTAYQARNTAIRSAAKRYRYTGMERDEETGLAYHSARYYLPWLGRWLSADPIGIGDGVNLYGYCRGNPIVNLDKRGTQATSSDSRQRPFRLTPLLNDFRLDGISGSFQLHDVWSSDRSVSGRGIVQGGVRSSFMLSVPRLELNTTGITNLNVTGAIDTNAGRAGVAVNGGVLLGSTSGLNLTLTGSGVFRIPVPSQLQISELPDSLLSRIPEGTGNARFSGMLAAGSTSLLNFRGSGNLFSGRRFDVNASGETLGNFGRFNLGVSGSVNADGALALDSGHAGLRIGLPGLSLDAGVIGTGNGDGSLALAGSSRLRLFGLPSLQMTGTGTASASGFEFGGSFSGAGPLFSSYITGNFNLGSSTGVSATAGVFGLTYTPSVSLPSIPTPPGLSVHGGSIADPWSPGGLTIGASLFQYSKGNFNYISGGLMPDFSNPTNLRLGISAQWHFPNP